MYCLFLSGKRPGSPVIQRALVNHTTNFEMPSRPQLQAQLCYTGEPHTVTVLIDSGADVNLLDITFASQLEIGQGPLLISIHATALDGRLLCLVTHRSIPLQLGMSGNHRETLTFHIIHAPQQPVVLGFPLSWET